MSTSSPKWSRKSARRASGARNAALAAVAAAFVAACSGGGGDAGIGLPPGQGPINWGAVQTLATNANNATPPAAVFGASGTVSVLWSQIGMPVNGMPSTVPLVGVRENTSGTTTFTPAASIDETQTFNAADVITQLRAERSALGSLAVWRRQLSGSGTRLVSAVREANGWGVLPIDTPSALLVADELTFAANDAGAQIAVWTEQQVTGERLVMVSARSGAGGWSAKVPAQANTAATGSQPAVAIDSAGVAIIVWRQGNAPGILRARSYNTTTGQFGNELEVDPGQFTNDTRNPRVIALPPGPGSFLASWEQAGAGGAYDMRANTGSATSWSNIPATLETGAGTVDQSLLVAGPNATAFAVWRQNNSVFFARFAAGQWSLARQVSGTVPSHTPRVAVDGNGNAVFVWLQTPSGSTVDDLFYATFTASNSAISGAFQLDTETTGAAASPSLSVAGNGAAVVAWLQSVANQANPNVVARVFRP